MTKILKTVLVSLVEGKNTSTHYTITDKYGTIKVPVSESWGRDLALIGAAIRGKFGGAP